MARATVLGRLTWRVATVAAVRDETGTARTLVLDVPGWPGHLAGQHVDVRLTAPDGYSTQRSYSIASAPGGDRVELTVERVPDGEVSPYLAQVLSPGDPLEVRGPIGGWFVWRPEDPAPVQLVAGGSGVVPLMAMVRTRAVGGSRTPFRLLYSARGPAAALYRDELDRASADGSGLEVTYAYTREVPDGWGRPPGRVDARLLTEAVWAPEREPAVFVCGPTGFVETVTGLLVAAGHDPARIRTERFGPSGGRS
ncbi:ferredoxin reductase [Streptosporangium fragile]|uniref:Ferredoxin reductase n=1 Tax=Streptosporangium fragile TaxID=46186 RepID=A0ABN3W7B9_9ACTN